MVVPRIFTFVGAKKIPLPEWSRKILAFRHALKLTQGELGKRLKTSAMAVSRWERGDTEPPAGAYIRLGNIAGATRSCGCKQNRRIFDGKHRHGTIFRPGQPGKL
jgi:transcriptional regulator with XRE-family HTH domain